MNVEEKTTDRLQQKIESLIIALGSDDGMVRLDARQQLVGIGHEALPFVIRALKSERDRVRWEAAKILTQVVDETTSGPLVETLKDDRKEIRWLAAEGLIRLGRESLLPLLEALVDEPDIAALREGAHHVLHDLDRQNLLSEEEQHLLEVLKSIEPESTVPIAAEHALRSHS